MKSIEEKFRKFKNSSIFQRHKKLCNLIIIFIKNNKLNSSSPFYFSTTLDLNSNSLNKNRIIIFFNNSWVDKIGYVNEFAEVLNLKLNKNVLKVLNFKQYFYDLYCGFEFSSDLELEKLKIYFNLKNDYYRHITSRDIFKHTLDSIKFDVPNIIKPSTIIDSFSLEILRNKKINIKIYELINKQKFRNFIFDFKQSLKPNLFNYVISNLGIFRKFIICHRIDDNLYRELSKKADLMLGHDIVNNKNVVRDLLKTYNFKSNFINSVALFKNAYFNNISFSLNGKLAVYYLP